jgi:hypothetical protein
MKVSLRGARRVALLCVVCLLSQAASAVNDFDTVHASTSDEIIAAMVSASGSGRPTIIKVAPGHYTFTQAFGSEFGSSVFPPVTTTIFIVGQNAADTIFDGQGNGLRFFTVLSSGKLVVRNATLTGGFALCGQDQDCVSGGGGAVTNVGGVLWFESSVVAGNVAISLDGFSAPEGGGIVSVNGDLHLVDTKVEGNVAFANGGGLRLAGGRATIKHSVVTQNAATIPATLANGGSLLGGGIFVTDADLFIVDSTISGNAASRGDDDEWDGFGAGIYSAASTVRIKNSAIINNTAVQAGAGGGIVNNGDMTLTNVTVGGNAAGTLGGGIYNGSTLRLQSVTIAGNSERGERGSGGSGSAPGFPPGCDPVEAPELCISGGGGLWNAPGAVVKIVSSVIAHNNGAQNAPSDCDGVLISEGYNAIGHDTRCTLQRANGTAHPKDQTNLKVKLGDFTDNGEAGHAHFPLLANSPLIDAGGKVGRQCTERDQIGQRRTDSDHEGRKDHMRNCDVGAIEFVRKYSPH